MAKKFLSILLVLVLVLGLLPAAGAAALSTSPTFSDMPDNWATEALESAVANGLLVGDDGKIMPDSPLTRAQMATIIARAFGATEEGDISEYTDVKSTDWFGGSMAKALKMGVMHGYDGRMNPKDNITREQAFAVLARAFKLAPATAINKTFEDLGDVSDWAKGEVYALVNAGYIQGSNGRINPQANISRAEFAQMIHNLIKQYIKAEGEYTEVADGNIMVNVPDATLKNVTINGDLIVGDGVGDGDLILDNVTLKGRLVARGGGANSIIIRGGSVEGKVIIAKVDGDIRVSVEGGADVKVIIIDDGKDDVIIEGTVGTVEVTAAEVPVVIQNATVEKIEVVASGATNITVANGAAVTNVVVNSGAVGTTLNIEGNVNTVETSAANTAVSGTGTVKNVTAKEGADNTTVTTPSTKINNEGASGVAVSAININKSTTTLVEGTTETLTATFTPSNASNKTITWTTSDASKATIDSTGKVRAVSAGTATITAKSNNGKTATCVVTVTTTVVPVSAIIVTGENNVTKITTLKGTLQMLADVKPTTATNKTVKWSVTNEDGSVTDKATINSNGLLTAVKNGKVKVKATSTSTPTVSDELGIEISGQLLPSTIVFNDAGPIAKIVGDAAFTNKVTGGDGDGAITYTSETPRTATVNKTTGEVTIVAVGSTVITATKAATKTHSEVTNNYSINIGNKASTAITKVEIIGDRFIGTELKTSLTPKEATALYQWKRVRFSPGPIVEDIVGATADKYTVTKEDNNWKIFVQVQGTGNYVGTIKSVETSAIMHNAIKERVVTATDVTAGQTLKQSKLSGTFKDFVKEEVSGKLEWVDSTTVVNKTGEYSWKFTPDNSVIYYPTTGVVNVKAIITDFAGGSGTITDPYKVSNVEQLNNVRKYLDKYFIQINDIDLNSGSFGSGEGWVPIGNMTNNFTGSYNGQGKEIKSLTIEAPKASRIGLFGQTSKGAKLSNIIINSCLVRGDAQVGALVGYNLGEVLNCKIYGDKETYIRGNNSVGGMVGYNKGTIDGCTGTTGYNVYGSIDTGGLVGTNDEGVVKSSNSSCVTKGDNNVGGLVGRNQGEIYNNYTENSQCEVNSGPDGKGKSWVKEVNIGGLVGANTGTISSCSAQNILVELQDKGVGGGLVGKNMGSIYQSYSKINNVRGFTNLGGEDICDLGGLVGYNSGTISQSFAKMNGISPVKGLYRLGGLVGSNAGTISDTYSTCSVDGHNDMGGLVGKNYKGSTISNSYAIGFIERRQLGKINWAGIVGYNDGTVKDCYYDKETTGRDDKGKGNPKTTEEMSVQSTFKNWDFKRIWTIGTDRYPILQWQSE